MKRKFTLFLIEGCVFKHHQSRREGKKQKCIKVFYTKSIRVGLICNLCVQPAPQIISVMSRQNDTVLVLRYFVMSIL